MDNVKNDILKHVKKLMLNHGYASIKMTLKQLIIDVLENKYSEYEVKKCLINNFLLFPSNTTERYWCIVIQQNENTNEEQLLKFKRVGKTICFRCEDILTKEELAIIQLCFHAIYIGQEPPQLITNNN